MGKLGAKLKAIKLKKGGNAAKNQEALDMISDEGAIPKISYGHPDDEKDEHEMNADPTMSDHSGDDEPMAATNDEPMAATNNYVVGASNRGEDGPRTGEIMGRVTLNKMFVNKNWQEMAWLQQNETTICFFKTKQDYLDWKHRTSEPHLYTEEERDGLIKSKIDFMEELQKPNVKGYSLSPVAGKSYDGAGHLYQFKLDCWMKLGPVTVAALGSSSKEEAQEIYNLINNMYIKAYDQLRDSEQFFPAAKPNYPQPQNNIIYS